MHGKTAIKKILPAYKWPNSSFVLLHVINFCLVGMKFVAQKRSLKVQGKTFSRTPTPAANLSSSKMKTCFTTDKGMTENRG